MNENIIPFGYYIIRTNHAKDLPSCCPPEYLSVAGCLCEAVIPDVDNIPLVSSNFEPETFAEKWKLSLDAANELFQFNRKHVAQISYARSNYISYETARKVKDTFFQERDEIALVGIGVLEPDILANPDLRQVSPLPEHGTLLGYDLYKFRLLYFRRRRKKNAGRRRYGEKVGLCKNRHNGTGLHHLLL